jgi:hypothetical protein
VDGMTEAEKFAVMRDKFYFFGWAGRGFIDAGDASDIYIAEQAVQRAFHMTGVAEYLEWLDWKTK